ncbi:hypothetical protein MT1_2736 [Pseudomonas sp. MT-1]|nr:hypothetical protein MT1_2736 [Pseudomonas sp. MT-1]
MPSKYSLTLNIRKISKGWEKGGQYAEAAGRRHQVALRQDTLPKNARRSDCYERKMKYTAPNKHIPAQR